MEIFKPKPVEKIPNNPLNTQERNDIFISDIYIDDGDISTMIIQEVPMFEPEVNKTQTFKTQVIVS